MRFAVIAAGAGNRLTEEGMSVPKPLVTVCGEPMIGRLLRIMRNCGAEGISVIVNPANIRTIEYLESVSDIYKLNLVVKATESSMHSLYELSPWLRDGKSCVTTVDTVFKEDEFRDYVDYFGCNEADGVMGVTDFVDDEKPLYVSVDERGMINGFYDGKSCCNYVSGGIYGLTEKSFDTLGRCVAAGQSRMRAFQRQMVADGLRLEAYRFGKIIDVDHISDIAKAEEMIKK